MKAFKSCPFFCSIDACSFGIVSKKNWLIPYHKDLHLCFKNSVTLTLTFCTPLQYSCLENPMGREACKLQSMGSLRVRQLSDFTFTFHFHALEKEMPTHSSVLAWRIPGTGEPGGLPSMGSHRVRHDWSDLATAAAATLTFKSLTHFEWIFACDVR